ncbi:unnamed protein product [Blepharisma stoltei]|uniref:MULE transposase domain-containing protein n=1 Tax=Blepharisma stoltei TaxID=1481888 RepID=A0AAU9KEM2_9CILI|nr:unnamed protein product [Blepharisma stoltei]
MIQYPKKRMPGCFAAMSSREKWLYSYIFTLIKFHISISGFPMKLSSITIDFEQALISSIKESFPNQRIIGCFYHLNKSLKRKAKALGIYKKKEASELRNKTDQIIKRIEKLCYKIDDLEVEVANIEKEFIESESLMKFINYFKKTWLKYFRDNTLNYSSIEERRYRSNSMLEGINGEIKKFFKDKGVNFMWSDFILALQNLYKYFYDDIIACGNKPVVFRSKAKILEGESQKTNWKWLRNWVN